MANGKHLTTAGGVPVADNQNSMTAGPRGPIVFEDFHLFEKLAQREATTAKIAFTGNTPFFKPNTNEVIMRRPAGAAKAGE